jgi:hypothetical protein
VINDLRVEVEKLKLALEVASSHNYNNNNNNNCDPPIGTARTPTGPRRAFFPEESADDVEVDVEVECTEYDPAQQQAQTGVEPSNVSNFTSISV